MMERLTKQTGPKVLKSLEANVKAIEADKFTQDASFNLETAAARAHSQEHQELHPSRALLTGSSFTSIKPIGSGW